MPAVPAVLAVEDDPIIRADLRALLERAGFEVCADARDGLEAVELARELSPDVVLLDLALPRLDGIEATRRILEHRDVPIVALTGYARDGLAERAVEAGATSYVVKPFAEEEIVGALLDAIEIGARQRARRDAVLAMRDESRAAITELVHLLGYPDEYAVELERRSFATGKLWRIAGD